MKLLNIVGIALFGSLLLVATVALTSEYLFGRELAMLTTIPVALAVGMGARRTAEKILGYTTLEAMKEGQDDTGN